MADGEQDELQEIRCGSCNYLMGYGPVRSNDYRCRYCQWEWDFFIAKIAHIKPSELPNPIKDFDAWTDSRNLRTGMHYAAQTRNRIRDETEKFILNLAYEIRIGDTDD